MLKILLAFLLLGVSASCFSETFQHSLKDWQGESFDHFMNGSLNLLADEPWHALENFQKAAVLVEKSEKFSFALSFLISFGQAIAFDTLGFREQCRQAIGSLVFAIDGYDNEDIEIKPNKKFQRGDDDDEIVQFLRNLVNVSPSRDVREVLFSFVEEIAEELTPAFQFDEAAALGNVDWGINDKEYVSIKSCKSWWKKLKKWTKEVHELLDLASKAFKAANEIKKNIDEWRNNHSVQAPYYSNPNASMADPNMGLAPNSRLEPNMRLNPNTRMSDLNY